MRRVTACNLRCTSRSLNHSIQIRCTQRLSPAYRATASVTRHSIPAIISIPHCRFSEQPANRPQREQNPAKPPPPSTLQQLAADDLKEARRKAQRDAILSRITRRDASKNAPPITWWSVAILAVLAAAVTFLLHEEKKQRQQSRKSVGTAKIGGSWTLVDTEGIPRTDHEFRGQYQLVYFGFTFCPDICPVELKKISDVINVVDEQGLGKYLQPLFITVDPQRDSIHQIREYIKEFHPRLLGLTGTPEQLKNCARAYRVYSMPGLEADAGSPDYLVDHSVIIYLIGPDNKLVEYFGSRQASPEIAKQVVSHLKSIAPRSVAQRAWDGLQGLLEK